MCQSTGDALAVKGSGAQLSRVTFKTSRLLDFCSEKELTAQTGHDREEWPFVVLKELFDNALDACEDAAIPPQISVHVDETGIQVADNGPGIPGSTIQGVIDFTVRVSSREAYVSPTRGAQGNALKTLLGMPFVLDGQQGQVDIDSQGIRHRITISVNRVRQEPAIAIQEHPVENVKTGTSIKVWWPNS